MELLVHVNKRIKSRPLVQLPVEALLLQYQDPAASSFVTVIWSGYFEEVFSKPYFLYAEFYHNLYKTWIPKNDCCKASRIGPMLA